MDEDLDGAGPQGAEGAEQVARWISVEPVDGVSFIDHDEGLPINHMISTSGLEQMIYTTRPGPMRGQLTER